MPAVSSAERAIDVPSRVRVGMVVLGFLPFVHAIAVVTPVVLVVTGRDLLLLIVTPLTLFLLPPLLVRLATLHRPLAAGRVELTSAEFLRWWFTAQCQVVFARLPFLEELLRMVPALYSAWLRLWGAKVGGLVYWSPGVAILDRSLVDVGDRVVFGVGARLNGHVIVPIEGRGTLFLGRVVIGSDALVGGYSTLLPGCVVASGEVTPGFRSVHAFTRLEGGRRTRLAVPGMNGLDAIPE